MLEEARSLDASDPLASFRDRFVISDPNLIYLDGNSLGRMPRAAAEVMDRLKGEWGDRLIRGWGEGWYDLPRRLGAKIARLIGADEDEVIVCDSTSVNLYKLVMAALAYQSGRTRIVTDDANFPSDLYILQGCAHGEVVVGGLDVQGLLSEDTALLALSHTAFKSGHIHDMPALTNAAHEAGALALWDLSHSVGAMPVELNRCSVDLAVGCTYKHLHGGPGAPAFLFVRRGLQDKLISPIWGWFGQRQPFAFDLGYTPAEGMSRFLAGTPPILSMATMEAGLDLVLEAGLESIRAKSVAQTEFLIRLWREHLEPLGFALNSPLDPAVRGSHVSIGHSRGLQINLALINEMKVIPDFRSPDNIRLGVAPLYTTYAELYEGVIRIRDVVTERRYEGYDGVDVTVT